LSFLVLNGCGLQDAKSVRATKEFYFTHINIPVDIELDNHEVLEIAERTLSIKFAKIDRELTSLARALDGVLDPTRQEQVAGLLNTFPWLSNAYVLDENARILGAIPAIASASVDFSYLSGKEIEPRELYAHVIANDGNAIFLLARPYIQSGTLVGYLGVSFDPRSLLPFVGDASNVFMRTVDDVLWVGDAEAQNTLLAGIDWTQVIDKDSLGKISKQGRTAIWFTRYYANMPLIFGVVGP